MPLGGGDLGLNVWVENSTRLRDQHRHELPIDTFTGTVLFYAAKSGFYDDNNSLVKLGRYRLTLSPNPFNKSFSQSLKLNDGYVEIKGNYGLDMKLWVDVYNPAIHVDVKSSTALSLTASYETWRYKDRPMGSSEQGMRQYTFDEHLLMHLLDQSDWDVYPKVSPTPITKADNISFYNGGVLFTHRNTANTTFDVTVKEQGLDQYADTMYNPLAYNTVSLSTPLEVKLI